MPSNNWGRQGEWPPKGKKQSKKTKPIKEPKSDLRKELEAKSMSEIRAYAKLKGLKAKDTDKSELIDEIIAEMEGN